MYEQITIYEHKNKQWNKNKVLYVAEELKESVAKSSGKKGPDKILSENQHLKINFVGKSLYTNSASSSSLDESKESEEVALSEVFKESNSGFWIWIEEADAKGHLSSLPYPFTVAKNNDKQEKIENCGIQNYFSEAKTCSKQDSDEWKKIYQQIKNIDKQEKKKGKWVDAEEICEAGNKRKWDISEDQLTNLKMFCAKPKEES